MQFLILNNGTSSFLEHGVSTLTRIILVALIIIAVNVYFNRIRLFDTFIGFEEDQDVEPSAVPLSFTGWFLSINKYEWQPSFIKHHDLLTISMNDYKNWCKMQNYSPNWDGGTEEFKPTI